MQKEKHNDPPMKRYLPDGEISYLNILIWKPLPSKGLNALRIRKSWWRVKDTGSCLKNWFVASSSTGKRRSCCSDQHSKNLTFLFDFLIRLIFLLPGYVYADKVWTVQGYESRKDFWFLSLKRLYCNQQRLNRVIRQFGYWWSILNIDYNSL